MMANVRIDVADDGQSATVRCLYNKWVLEPTGPVLDAVGRYRSEFGWAGAAWEFREHVVNSEWRRNSPAGLTSPGTMDTAR